MQGRLCGDQVTIGSPSLAFLGSEYPELDDEKAGTFRLMSFIDAVEPDPTGTTLASAPPASGLAEAPPAWPPAPAWPPPPIPPREPPLAPDPPLPPASLPIDAEASFTPSDMPIAPALPPVLGVD